MSKELKKENIYVTKTFFPPIEEYNKLVSEIWENRWLTNRGKLVQRLEEKLQNTLLVKNLFLTTNGTLPIQIGLKVLGNGGEVITTPFSYVATTSSIVWENCTPVFVDIHPEYLTIDEEKIEAAITNKTTAILATHVFGNPCNVERIEEIAVKNGLRVIYDAAHCFGVEYKGKSLFEFGDMSTCSFHATKIFHCGEGGAVVCNNDKLNKELFYHHNFGHDGPLKFHGLGINAKMSELQAAMGLAVLPYMKHIYNERKRIVEYYNKNLNFSQFKTLSIRPETKWNYSYYPVIFDSEEILLRVLEKLNDNNIYPRRYFSPSLNRLPYLDSVNMEVSDSISERILCLPLFVGLTEEQGATVVNLVNGSL